MPYLGKTAKSLAVGEYFGRNYVYPQFLDGSTMQRSQGGVLAGGKNIDPQEARHFPEGIQRELHSAKKEHGHALCLCQGHSAGIKLVIRERGGRLFLASWPDAASAHALACPFYVDGRSLAQKKYTDSSVEEHNQRLTLGLHHGFSNENRFSSKGEHANKPANNVGDMSSERGRKLHLWGLLHFLWERSGMNRWSKGWSRDWGYVRYSILRVASGFDIGSVSLSRQIYVPRVWRESEKQSIREAWKDFSEDLRINHRRARTVKNAIVIGQVKRMAKSEYGYALNLRNHAEPIYIAEKLADNLKIYSRSGWVCASRLTVGDDDFSEDGVIAAMRVEATPNGTLVMVEGCMMRVNTKFIPVSSSFERRVADALIENERSFLRPLHYDLHRENLPSFVVTDVKTDMDQDIGVFVYGSAVAQSLIDQHEKNNRAVCRKQGLEYFSIRATMDDKVLILPPSTTLSSSMRNP